jgi:nucleoside-diphosphate-sugar epimerase
MQRSKSEARMAERKALVLGVTGTTGYSTAKRLLADGWEVHGVSRRPADGLDGVVPVHVDLTDRAAVAEAIGGGGFTHVFFCIWIRHETEDENRRTNSAIVSDVLDALSPGRSVEHVALVTGLKHYLGPFESYGKAPAPTPFREDQDRLEFPNFYYDQEDVLFAAAERDGFTWSVHRAHTVIGWAPTTVMNMGATLAAYGAICRELGQQFVFPGSPTQYEGVTDVTDAEVLAEQLAWSATDPKGANQALNIVNGDVFRWKRMWEVLAADLGVETGPYPGEARPLEEQMEGMEPVWEKIVAKHGLQALPLEQVASWWHSDADLGRPIETFADMTKSRGLGFQSFRRTDDTFRNTFAALRAQRIIPPAG